MYRLFALGVVVIVAAAASQLHAPPADASFHCMRIHAVMAGVNGDTSQQYVELRMPTPGQTVVAGTQLLFFSGAGGMPMATFTFPSSLPMGSNGAAGASILIATTNLQTAAGVTADFTMPANVLPQDGKVQFTGAFNCNLTGTVIDSVAYGSVSMGVPDCPLGAPVNAAAPPLPTTGTQALTLNNLNLQCGVAGNNNSTEYTLQAAAPRNNAGVVGSFNSDSDGDLVPDISDSCPGTAPAALVDGSGCSAAQVDSDGDTICNPGAPSLGPGPCTGINDNCPSVPNLGQANADGDAFGDACDNCPLVATVWVVPLGDDDCDAFPTVLENGIGTDPLVACNNGIGLPDWPPDINDDVNVNILDVFTMFPFWLGFSNRHDLNDDGAVNILDVFKTFAVWLQSCP